ncbi:MAG TPA: HAD hydrolase-like protein [Acidimicrobiales bacterium]
MPRPVGFDLDLTLIDSRASILESFRAVANSTGVSLDLDEIESRMGLKLEDELAHWFDAPQIAGVAALYRRHYVDIAPTSSAAMPGAHESLLAVKESGAETVIITAKHESAVGLCLAATGLFADQVFSLAHGPEKAVILRRIGASLYVGDTPADVRAASDASVTAVGVPTGSFDAAALADAGAEVILESLTDFPAWYMGFHADV